MVVRSASGRSPNEEGQDLGSSLLNRFSGQPGGIWGELSPPSGESRRQCGTYHPAGDAKRAVQLTVLRAVSAASASASAAAPQPAVAPKALSLAGGTQCVLLFHGLSSTPLELQYIARGLHRAGYSVRIPIFPGYSHGSPTPRPSNHRDWAAMAVAEFDRVVSQYERVAVGGLCVGALLALHVAAARSDAVSHVVSLSTPLRYDGWAAPWSRRFLPLARLFDWSREIKVKEPEPFGIKDERLRAWIIGQTKEQGGSDYGWGQFRVGDLLEAQDLMSMVREGLPKVTAPTLCVHAREDDLASPRSAFEVVSSVGSQRVHCVLLNDSYHIISIDKEKARVLMEVKEFLQGSRDSADPVAGLRSTPAFVSTQRSTEHVRA